MASPSPPLDPIRFVLGALDPHGATAPLNFAGGSPRENPTFLVAGRPPREALPMRLSLTASVRRPSGHSGTPRSWVSALVLSIDSFVDAQSSPVLGREEEERERNRLRDEAIP